MAFSVEQLTIEDFIGSGSEQIVADCQWPDCAFYSTRFNSKAREAEESGDAKAQCLFSLLGGVMSMMLSPDDPAAPFKPVAQFHDGRTMIPSDLTDEEIVFLRLIVPHVADPEMRARLADLVWVRKRDFGAAQVAVISYLEAAAPLETEDHWSVAVTRMERASELAARLNNRDLVKAVTHHLEAALATAPAPGPVSFFPAKLMRLLQVRRAGDPSAYASVAEGLARRTEADGEWYKAREYWDIAAQWHQMANEPDAARASRLCSAETFVQEAEAVKGHAASSYMVAAHWLESAIHALRRVGGQQERIGELHLRLLEYQRASVSEMGVISHPLDLGELTNQALAQVKGKGLYDALFALALISSPPKAADLERQAREHREQFVLQRLFARNYVNEMGRTVARRGSFSPGEDDEDDLRAEMYRLATIGRSVHVLGAVEPIREQINLEHEVRTEDFLRLVSHNVFVPEGREMAFARGLHAGMQGDWAVAAHLLIPQVENSIRHILSHLGVITSGLDDEGIQVELDLNRTLRLAQFTGPLSTVLGADTVFEMRGLLVERFGANLRNDMAHGLLRYDAFFSYPCVYLWWLVLRLCCIPVITGLAREQQGQESKTDGEATSDDSGLQGDGGQPAA